MSAHGGKRPGAGRKVGSQTTKTRLIAQEAAAQGITPIEVLLGAMRHAWDAGDMDKACERAASAAPYVHPRLASTDVTQDIQAQVTNWPLPKTPLDEVPAPDGV